MTASLATQRKVSLARPFLRSGDPDAAQPSGSADRRSRRGDAGRFRQRRRRTDIAGGSGSGSPASAGQAGAWRRRQCRLQYRPARRRSDPDHSGRRRLGGRIADGASGSRRGHDRGHRDAGADDDVEDARDGGQPSPHPNRPGRFLSDLRSRRGRSSGEAQVGSATRAGAGDFRLWQGDADRSRAGRGDRHGARGGRSGHRRSEAPRLFPLRRSRRHQAQSPGACRGERPPLPHRRGGPARRRSGHAPDWRRPAGHAGGKRHVLFLVGRCPDPYAHARQARLRRLGRRRRRHGDIRLRAGRPIADRADDAARQSVGGHRRFQTRHGDHHAR